MKLTFIFNAVCRGGANFVIDTRMHLQRCSRQLQDMNRPRSRGYRRYLRKEIQRLTEILKLYYKPI